MEKISWLIFILLLISNEIIDIKCKIVLLETWHLDFCNLFLLLILKVTPLWPTVCVGLSQNRVRGGISLSSHGRMTLISGVW